MSDLSLPPGLAHVPFDEHQLAAIHGVRSWLEAPDVDRIHRVYGCAGVGKTSIARAAVYGWQAAYAAPTGKAACRMRHAGCPGAGTLHSVLYRPYSYGGSVRFEYAPSQQLVDADVVVVDEGSMVDEQVGVDLMLAAKKVLVLCDPFQLPPVNGVGYFGEVPDVLLTHVHRQALNSPVLFAATQVRERQTSELAEGHNEHGRLTVLPRDMHMRAGQYVDQILVGRHATRRSVNTQIRLAKGYVFPRPEVGEKLVCLRNNPALGLYNGGLWEVADTPGATARDGWFNLKIRSLDDPELPEIWVKTNYHVLNEELDCMAMPRDPLAGYFNYGYAITVHKAQGSEWRNVLLYDESQCFREEQCRWLYTGLTRAANELYIIRN